MVDDRERFTQKVPGNGGTKLADTAGDGLGIEENPVRLPRKWKGR
ncbi:MAG: hypothetical protein R3F31_03545 [Verrucomicrobiales bacterium]